MTLLEKDPLEFFIKNPSALGDSVMWWLIAGEIREICDLGFGRRNKGDVMGGTRVIWDFGLVLGVKC